MKTMKNFILIVLSILIFCIFTGCDKNNLNGAWVAEGYTHMGVTFSGNKFTLTTNPTAEMNMFGSIYQAQDGTYSISGSQMEFKFSDGRIETRHFSRTENTITLGSTRLMRN